MNIMPIRLQILKEVYPLFHKTGMHLLRGTVDSLIPVERAFGGDVGCTYFITHFGSFFNLVLTDAIWLFYFTLVTVSSLVSIAGLWCLSKTFASRIIALLGVAMIASVAWSIGDEYIVGFCAAACLPLTLFVFEHKNNKVLGISLFLLGAIATYANFMRIHTGTLLMIVVVVRLFFYQAPKLIKCALLVSFILPMLLAKSHIKSVFVERNTYLKTHGYGVETVGHGHTLWHNIYAGFGFIQNDKDLYFSDSCSALKVASIAPGALYLSSEYNFVLRHEIFELVTHSPVFVLRVFFAKTGVLFLYLLLCLLPVLWALCLCPFAARIHLMYCIALVWTAAPGLLTIPNALYLVGFITIAWLYGLHALVYALDHNSFFFYIRKIKHFFVQWWHRVLQMEWR